MVLMVYCGALLLFFAVATCCHSLLEVEVLHLNQLVFLLHFQTSHYTHSWAVLQTLTFCFGNFAYYDSEKSNVDFGDAFQDMVFGTRNYHTTMLFLLISLSFLSLLTLAAKLIKALCGLPPPQSPASSKPWSSSYVKAILALIMRVNFSWALSFLMVTVFLLLSNTEENSANLVGLVLFLKFFLAMFVYLPCFALYCESK